MWPDHLGEHIICSMKASRPKAHLKFFALVHFFFFGPNFQCPEKHFIDKYAFVLSLAATSPHLHASVVIKSVITFAGGTTQLPLIQD